MDKVHHHSHHQEEHHDHQREEHHTHHEEEHRRHSQQQWHSREDIARKRHEERRHYKEELARKRHEKWLRQHREAQARSPRLVVAWRAVRGGTVWGTRLVKRTSPLKRDMKRMELLPFTPARELEVRRTRAVVLAIIVLVVVVVGCFLWIAGR